MATIESLTNKLTYANRRTAFAWAKYYERMNTHLHDDHAHHATYVRYVSDDAIPTHIKTEFAQMAETLKKKWECPICLDMIEHGDLEITNCGHCYCKPCLSQLKQNYKQQGNAKWECATCRRKHNYNDE